MERHETRPAKFEVPVTAVAYVSRVRIERVKCSLRRAYLPSQREPVLFGVHDEIAEHYKAAPGSFEPHATTLDYVVAAAAG
jgi:hypothetical protein